MIFFAKIHNLFYNYNMENYTNDCITLILGGGKGTRLMPLTTVRSKPAVPFGGKYRLIDIPISNSINNGLEKIFILTQFNSFSLNRHIVRTYKFDNFSKGFIELIAAEQTVSNPNWFQGTADAVRQVMSHLQDYKPKHVLILSGDQLYKMDLKKMVYDHVNDRKRDVTISCIPVDRSFAPDFGLMKTAKDDAICDFTEKPQTEELINEFSLPDGRCMASMGIYLFDFDVLNELLEANPDKTDFGRDIIPQSITSHKVEAFKYEGYWEDIGTIKAFFEANIKMAGTLPPFDLYSQNDGLFTRPRYLPPAKILGTKIDNTLVSEGSIIMADSINDSIIGIRSFIRKGCTLEKVVMMGADFFSMEDSPVKDNVPGIGVNCKIKNAILDKNCWIGDNVTLVNEANHENYEDEYLIISDGVIVVPKDMVIPDNYKI